MKKILLWVTYVLSVLIAEDSFSQQISPLLFGQNAWMPDSIGNVFFNGKLHKNWGQIQEGKATVIRFGGIAADEHRPTNYQYIKVIDSARAHGMEPIIQVPFNNYKYSASTAAEIVHYINKVRNKNIKYWIIGNEPDLKYGYAKSSQVAAYIKQFSSAMKAVDPTIKIIGPETSWYNPNIINGLVTPGGLDDITGKDESGRYYIDIISFHTYPFNGSQSRADVISNLTASGKFEDDLKDLNSKIAQCNSAHGRTGAYALKTAVTEANINYLNPAADNLYGNGANSYLGGQFWAEMLAICMRQKVEFINFWSVIEGNSTGNTNLGYINPSNNSKKPSFYFFKMMAENFGGTYVNCTSNISSVKAFACKQNNTTTVMILNQDASSSFNYSVRLDKQNISSGSQLKINVDGQSALVFSGVIEKESSLLLQVSSTGTIIKAIEYKLHGHADSNLPPETRSDLMVSNEELLSDEALGVYPNPAKDHLNIFFPSVRKDDKDPELTIINSIGQRVYYKKLEVLDGQIKQLVNFDKIFAPGVYMVNVNVNGERYTKKILIN